jgi:adenylate cyclase
MVDEPVHGHDENSEEWRRILTGEDPTLPHIRRGWKLLPSSPRCKLCAAPFRGVGRLLTKVIMHGPSQANPLMCNICFGKLRKTRGGADIELTVLFADIRGSTGLAERLPAREFRELVERFYTLASRAIDHHDGIVDKFLGDGVMALFIPVLTGEDHAGRAIAAGAELLEMAERSDLTRAGIRVGAGIHRGTAFTGVMGADERLDFTALGDTVNIAARLGALAGPGELLVSRAAWDSSAHGLEGVERREVEVHGRTERLEVVVHRPLVAV